jgi:hypothetical protein
MPRLTAGPARSLVTLEQRAAVQVKATYVPIETRVIRIAGVNITGARRFKRAEGANQERHSTLSLAI